MDIEALERKFQNAITNLQEQITMVAGLRNPIYSEDMFKEMQEKYQEMFERYVVLNNKVNMTLSDDKFIRIVTNDEIKELYSQSGMMIKEIAEDFKQDIGTAWRHINGEFLDATERYRLYMYLQKKCIENKRKLDKDRVDKIIETKQHIK